MLRYSNDLDDIFAISKEEMRVHDFTDGGECDCDIGEDDEDEDETESDDEDEDNGGDEDE